MTEPPIETGADGIAAHPRPTGHRWMDLSIAFAAITISLVSLLVAIDNGITERRMVAASSWPFVVADETEDAQPDGGFLLAYTVTNRGIGPARLQSATVSLDGRKMHTRRELLQTCCGFAPGDLAAEMSAGLRQENPLTGVIAPQGSITALAVQETQANKQAWSKFEKARLVLRACYCSVLDDCWTTDLSATSRPKRVAQCAASDDDYRN